MKDQYGTTVCEACRSGNCEHCKRMWWDDTRKQMVMCIHECRFQEREITGCKKNGKERDK